MTEETKKKLRDENNFHKPILEILQKNGGELKDRKELTRLLPLYTDFSDEDLAYFEITQKGNRYQPYLFGRNLALNGLKLSDFLTCEKGGPVKLTTKGLNFNLEVFDAEKDIYENEGYISHFKDLKERQKNKSIPTQIQEQEDEAVLEEISKEEQNKLEILETLKKMDNYKFEKFINGLLSQMGFEVDPKLGTKKSRDGGIDGLAYSFDKQTLNNSIVVTQVKRFVNTTVGSPDIDKLRGSMSKYNADYGVFITTSTFSRDAKEEARKYKPRITTIDGSQLVDLMIEYKYKLKEVILWEPDLEFFNA